ncbi:hypothetical protein NC652_039845 [Populus alba x Populus x berolinensis]|nr:hypothetical protein NC652_039845 [Populus alba x Populus x berolinensis]
MHAWHGLQRRDPVIEGRIDYNGDEFVVDDQLMISIRAGDPVIEGRIDYNGDEFVVDDQLMISILAGSEYCCNK